MSGVGQTIWHLPVTPHFPDASNLASKQRLRNAIHTMVADGRMAVPGLRMRVMIPQLGIDIPLFPVAETVRDGVVLPSTRSVEEVLKDGITKRLHGTLFCSICYKDAKRRPERPPRTRPGQHRTIR